MAARCHRSRLPCGYQLSRTLMQRLGESRGEPRPVAAHGTENDVVNRRLRG